MPEPWSSDRIWDAVDAWRWSPPGATRVVRNEYELAVTPGSYALTYVWGFRVTDDVAAERRLEEVEARTRELGGTGARFQVTPRSLPADLPRRLERRGYRACEEAEVLVWTLREPEGAVSLPTFRAAEGVGVREVGTEAEYAAFGRLGAEIFGDPAPSPETERRFLEEFRQTLATRGTSNRFLAYLDGAPVGRAGSEVVGPVARFWGTGVRREYRGRGIYGALVAARCAAGAARGAEIALVAARVGTSGPILQHHGFRPMGSVRIFEVRW